MFCKPDLFWYTSNMDISKKIEEWMESYKNSIKQTLEKKADNLVRKTNRFGKIFRFDKLIPFITNITNIFAK